MVSYRYCFESRRNRAPIYTIHHRGILSFFNFPFNRHFHYVTIRLSVVRYGRKNLYVEKNHFVEGCITTISTQLWINHHYKLTVQPTLWQQSTRIEYAISYVYTFKECTYDSLYVYRYIIIYYININWTPLLLPRGYISSTMIYSVAQDMVDALSPLYSLSLSIIWMIWSLHYSPSLFGIRSFVIFLVNIVVVQWWSP
jgi:hypothetical protein